ncbi:uncharacterized protein LOC110684878 [Chenopodium quinoa]|uniref:uncharacterized protein LOC110684878 n=1 Tax=Chenopodium quinoa TaxID=63459 RepID=UPI000B78CD50|nr:uncharacterized protein LOC110684878 [Chenopodium quinoa]
MVLYTGTDSVWCKAFPPTVEGLAAEWYRSQEKGSVYSYSGLKRLFMDHFVTLVDRTKLTTELMSLEQGETKSLRDFITRLNKEATSIPNMSQEVALLEMQSGLLPGSAFREYMGKKNLKTLAEALGKAHEFIKGDETDRAMLARRSASAKSGRWAEPGRVEAAGKAEPNSAGYGRADQQRRDNERSSGQRRQAEEDCRADMNNTPS